MNKNLLDTRVQQYINENLDTDFLSILFKEPIFDGISNRELVQQLEAKKKCEKKLPTWFRTPGIYYPNKLNVEQSSSEVTAKYKAEIVEGNSLLDATGGLGVDSYLFGKKMAKVIHCETNTALSRIAAHNFRVMGAENIHTFPKDGLKFLEESKNVFDWVYLDPSRRNEAKEKMFLLTDCSPNVLNHLDQLFLRADRILMKTSPLLDLSKGIKELKFVKEVHVVGVKNEVKELLWVLTKEYSEDVQVKTINIAENKIQAFDFSIREEKEALPTYGPPYTFLYEPNAAIFKSGAFKVLGKSLQLTKLQEHTHLYTSNVLREFPGKTFRIESIFPFSKRTLRQFKGKKANVKVRNFPESVSQIRKKYGIRDGGDSYLFFIKDFKNISIIVQCTRV